MVRSSCFWGEKEKRRSIKVLTDPPELTVFYGKRKVGESLSLNRRKKNFWEGLPGVLISIKVSRAPSQIPQKPIRILFGRFFLGSFLQCSLVRILWKRNELRKSSFLGLELKAGVRGRSRDALWATQA